MQLIFQNQFVFDQHLNLHCQFVLPLSLLFVLPGLFTVFELSGG